MIIYHKGCYDGFTAAWVAHRAIGGGELVAAHYGNAPPPVDGRDVYVVDFSYPREVLLGMADRARSLVVLDHHATARDALADLPFCTFDMEESGASLTWRHFHGATLTPADGNPLVRYVRDRDLWRWELPYSREVNAWIRSFGFDLDTWDEMVFMLETGMLSVIEAGSAIRRVETQTVTRQSRHYRTVTIHGVTFRATNATDLLSETAGELAKETGAGAVWFARTDGRIQWSVRGDGRVDVSAVAKAYGGGGHRSASGFDVSWEEHGRLWNG